MKNRLLFCFWVLLQNQSIAQEFKIVDLIDALYGNGGVSSILNISKSDSTTRPLIIRIIDLEGTIFTKDTAIEHSLGNQFYHLYIVSKPKAIELINMNTGQCREILVSSPINHIEQDQYFFSLCIYQYGCLGRRFELSKYGVEVKLQKSNKRYKVVEVKCCSDMD